MENRRVESNNGSPLIAIILIVLIVGVLFVSLNFNNIKEYFRNKNNNIVENNYNNTNNNQGNNNNTNNNEGNNNNTNNNQGNNNNTNNNEGNNNNTNNNQNNNTNNNEGNNNNTNNNQNNNTNNNEGNNNNTNNNQNNNTNNNQNDVHKKCTYPNKVLTYVGQNKKIIDCENASLNSSDENIVVISKDGIITPKKIGTATIQLTNNNETHNIMVYVDHQKIVSGNDTLVLYEVNNASSISSDYDVYVKLPGESNYHKIQVFKVQVSRTDMNENWHSSYASYTNFDFKGTVNVKVIPKKSYTDFRLRGNIYSQNSRKSGNEILFNITNYGVISLETKNGSNYDSKTNLHIFANTLDNNFDNIDINNTNTIYIGPGEHKCANGNCSFDTDKNILKEKRKSGTSSSSYPSAIELKSNDILYISGSAIVHSQVKLDKWNDDTKQGTKLSNIKILGRGTLDTSDLITSNINSNNITFTDSNVNSGLIRIIYSKNITVDGIFLKNAKAYNVYIKDSDGVNISNLKVISSGKYTDGIHILSSRTVNVNNAFIRTCDDGVAIYSSRGSSGYKSGSFVGLNGNSTTMNFNNLLLWIDNGRSVYIGGHGNFDSVFGQGNKISDITFKKMRILENNKRIEHDGALTIGAADNNYVLNIAFNNVIVDNLIEGNLISVKNYCSNYPASTYENTKASKCGYIVNNITFNDINWNGRFDNTQNVNSWISLFGTKESNNNECSVDNKDHVISKVTFKDIKIGNIKLQENNKNTSYQNIPIYTSNNCVYNQNIN